MTEHLIEIGLLALTNLITFFGVRRKYKASVKQTEVHTLDDTLNVYIKIISDLEKRVNILQTNINRIEEQFEAIKLENEELHKENDKLKELHDNCEFKERKEQLDEFNKNK